MPTGANVSFEVRELDEAVRVGLFSKVVVRRTLDVLAMEWLAGSIIVRLLCKVV